MAYLLLAALIFLADFFVKSQIEARKPSDFPVELSHGLKLERHHNRGFFLNRLEEKPRLVRALAACAAVPLALWCVISMAKKGGAVKKRRRPSFWAEPPPTFSTGSPAAMWWTT